MSELFQLADLLSEREKQGFIQYLQKRNKRPDAKNITIFKAILKEEEEGLKKRMGENAYHVSKKRLSDNLLDFISSKTLETEATVESEVIKYLVIARKLFHHEKHKLAFKLLLKARKKAESIQHYTLLNEVYHLFIEYSPDEEAIQQEKLFEAFEENFTLLLASEKRNMATARLKQAFKNLHKSTQSVDSILNEFYSRIEKEGLNRFQFKDLFQLIEVVDSVGAYYKNYAELNLFFTKRLQELKGTSSDNEFQLIYHIRIIYLMANIYFRKKDFLQSLAWLEDMHNQMKRYNNEYYSFFLNNYTTLMALNLNFTGKAKEAAGLLDVFLAQDNTEVEQLKPILCRSMIYFQQNEPEACHKLLAKLQRSDDYYEKKAGLEWLLNKKYMEVLLHIELENIDLLDSSIKALKRKFGDYFRKHREFQIIPFLKLVQQYVRKPELVKENSFIQKVDSTIIKKEENKEDLFFMCFYAWLKSKMENRPIYQVTLELK